MDLSFMSENLASYMGTGLLFVLLLCGVLFLGFRMKKGPDKAALVWFPVYVLLIYFCPLWAVYMKLRDDAEILYRILWMLPVGVIVAYAFTEAYGLIPRKFKAVSVVAAIALIMLSGQYVYVNKQFSKAENAYHVPDAVVDICDELIIPGREVRVCFPIEMIQYVRQYTALICQPYGRDTLLWGADYNIDYSTIQKLLQAEVLDAEAVSEELRSSDTPYLVVAEGTEFDGDMTDYEFTKVSTIDGYDIYLDDNARLTLEP